MQRKLRLIINENFKGLYRIQHEYIIGFDKEGQELTIAINFLQVARISLANVALNIITCL